jgi:Arc/MetJ-type ribon-helix-helix transcriptional regulator
MTVQIAVRIPTEQAEELDRLVDAGAFGSRTAAIRAAIARLIADERERAIGEAYRKGYAAFPQEDWIGEVGLALMSARVQAEIDDEPL